MKNKKKLLTTMILIGAMMLSLLAASVSVMAVDGYSKNNRGTSKKGIQITGPHLMYQAVELGVSSVFVNFKIDDLLYETYSDDYVFTYKNKKYVFNSNAIQSYIDNFVYAKNNGIEKIYVDLICGKFPGLTYDVEATAFLYAFNTATATGRNIVKAVFTEIASKLGAYVDYWIISSEVNDQHQYYEMGAKTVEEYAVQYEKAMRIMNTAAKAYNKNSQILACIDHEWTSAALGRFDSRAFLLELAKLTKEKDYNWGVAIHPYPEPLTSSNFWNDELNAAFKVPDAQRITMYNIEVMTDFMQTTQMQYNGKARSLSITETGFSAYENGVEDQNLQAAAIAYAYYKAEADPIIDTFIMRTYKDEAPEVAGNMWFGVTDAYGNRRKSYDVFKYMDTKYGTQFTNKYIQYITGTTGGSWSDLISNFSSISFKKNPLAVTVSVTKEKTSAGMEFTITTKGYGGSGGYQYRLDFSDGYSTTAIRGYSTSNKVTLVEPFPSTGYLNVTIMDSNGNTKTESTYISDVISAPVISKASSVSDGVKLTWNTVPEAEGYYLYRDGKQIAKLSKSSSSTSTYTDRTAVNGTKYVYTLKSYEGSRKSKASEKKTITYMKPVSITSVRSTTNGVALTWSANSAASGYYIYRSSDGYYYDKIKTLSAVTSYTDCSMYCDDRYYYKITPYITRDGSKISGPASSVKTVNFVSAVKLSGITNYSTGIRISWNYQCDSTGYAIYRKEGSGDYKFLKTISDTYASGYTDKDVKNGVRYYYKLRKINSIGGSRYYSVFSSVATTVRINPVNISTLSVRDGYIRVSWEKNASASGYVVYRSVNGGSYTQIAELSTNVTYYDDKTATVNGNKYAYKIKVVKIDNSKKYRSELGNSKFTYMLTKPDGVAASNPSASKLKITWNSNQRASGYEIIVIKGTTKNIYTVSGTDRYSRVIDNVVKGETYKVYVRAYKVVNGVKYYSASSACATCKITK